MMSWSTAPDLRAQVMRLWERGELLREGLDAATSRFPLRLGLRAPAARSRCATICGSPVPPRWAISCGAAQAPAVASRQSAVSIFFMIISSRFIG